MDGLKAVEARAGRRRKLASGEEIERVADGERPGAAPEAVAVRWDVSKATYSNVRARVLADRRAGEGP